MQWENVLEGIKEDQEEVGRRFKIDKIELDNPQSTIEAQRAAFKEAIGKYAPLWKSASDDQKREYRLEFPHYQIIVRQLNNIDTWIKQELEQEMMKQQELMEGTGNDETSVRKAMTQRISCDETNIILQRLSERGEIIQRLQKISVLKFVDGFETAHRLSTSSWKEMPLNPESFQKNSLMGDQIMLEPIDSDETILKFRGFSCILHIREVVRDPKTNAVTAIDLGVIIDGKSFSINALADWYANGKKGISTLSFKFKFNIFFFF